MESGSAAAAFCAPTITVVLPQAQYLSRHAGPDEGGGGTASAATALLVQTRADPLAFPPDVSLHFPLRFFGVPGSPLPQELRAGELPPPMVSQGSAGALRSSLWLAGALARDPSHGPWSHYVWLSIRTAFGALLGVPPRCVNMSGVLASLLGARGDGCDIFDTVAGQKNIRLFFSSCRALRAHGRLITNAHHHNEVRVKRALHADAKYFECLHCQGGEGCVRSCLCQTFVDQRRRSEEDLDAAVSAYAGDVRWLESWAQRAEHEGADEEGDDARWEGVVLRMRAGDRLQLPVRIVHGGDAAPPHGREITILYVFEVVGVGGLPPCPFPPLGGSIWLTCASPAYDVERLSVAEELLRAGRPALGSRERSMWYAEEPRCVALPYSAVVRLEPDLLDRIVESSLQTDVGRRNALAAARTCHPDDSYYPYDGCGEIDPLYGEPPGGAWPFSSAYHVISFEVTLPNAPLMRAEYGAHHFETLDDFVFTCGNIFTSALGNGGDAPTSHFSSLCYFLGVPFPTDSQTAQLLSEFDATSDHDGRLAKILLGRAERAWRSAGEKTAGVYIPSRGVVALLFTGQNDGKWDLFLRFVFP
jgi:hypothetical protein